MPSELPWAWLNQAGSDLSIAARCFDPSDERTACHAVAQYQQTVEMSVKAIVAALNEKGIIRTRPGYSHGVGKLIQAKRFSPR